MNGIIYKLKCKSTDDFYIGSTKNLNKALQNIKCLVKQGRNTPLFDFIRDNGGMDNFDKSIILYCDNDKLDNYKQQQIKLLNPSLNIRIPLQTRREYNIKNREKHNAYKRGRKIECIYCNKIYSRDSINRHYKTKKHLTNKAKHQIKIIVV